VSSPQPGIFDEDNPHQHHLEWIANGHADPAAVIAALGVFMSAAKNHQGPAPVCGFGPDYWRMLVPDSEPVPVKPFRALGALSSWTAPTTQADVWVWIQGRARDEVHDLARVCVEHLGGGLRITQDVSVFKRYENRDLMGFVDGTANPQADARRMAALVEQGSAHAGASVAITQRWRHSLGKFNALAMREQEAVIGRTKADDIELEGDAMPLNSHVSRTDVKIDGKAMKIFRRSAPYGDARDHGLFFVAFACEQLRIQIQLERMFGLTEDGVHDRIIEFSQALSGSYWFVPSANTLAALIEA
jgi:porphyrinogen peroxidase